MKTKECRYCCEIKTIYEFTRNQKSKDGLCHFCKDCLMGYRNYLRHQKEKIKIEDKTKEYKIENNEYVISFE